MNDENALTVFVEGDFIHNSNDDTMVLKARLDEHYLHSSAYFTTKNSTDKSQKFTVNSDGTISSDEDP